MSENIIVMAVVGGGITALSIEMVIVAWLEGESLRTFFCWHKWRYSTKRYRTCKKCDRSESYRGEIRGGDGYWYVEKECGRLL